MAEITCCAAVTALYKYYHTDRSKFLTAVSTATEYPDEFFAVALDTSTTTNQTIVQFIQNSAATWVKTVLTDPNTSAGVSLTGTSIGTFQRVLNKVYYGDEENDVQIIEPRRSSGDTRADYCGKAGLPDPNASRVISRMDEFDYWVYTNSEGTYTASLDFAPTHRLYGRAAISVSQFTADKTVSVTYFITATGTAYIDLTQFDDTHTSNQSDFICFNVFRFDKKAIQSAKIEIGCDNGTATWTNYFSAPIALSANTNLNDLETSASWDHYDFQQNTMTSKWGLNPYDNQFFRVRLRKSWFTQEGSPDWSTVYKIRFSVQGGSEATSDNPARISFNDIKMMKTPPIAKPYRIQYATFDPHESGSTSGWVDSAGDTADFNYELAKEGTTCLIVGAGNATSPIVSLTFASAKDFATFPDGTTAETSCVLRANVGWEGLGKNQLLAANTADWSALAVPRIRFHNGANYRECFMLSEPTLRGGGVLKQIRFNTSADDSGSITSPWTGDGTMDWTSVDKISIYGIRYDGTAIDTNMYIDDLRLEQPKCSRPVNIFEPIDLYVLDAADEFADAYLENYAKYVDLATDVWGLWIKNMRYKTHGYGHMVYPDYDHSSIGYAGCTLRSYGSTPFGVTMEVKGSKYIDLNNYYIPVFNPIAAWSWPDNWGFRKFDTIPAGIDDRFTIWMASEDPQAVAEIIIRLHGETSGGAIDLENYWEYRISGIELAAKLQMQTKRTEAEAKKQEDVKKAIKDLKGNDLNTIMGTISNNWEEVEDFFSETIKNLGKDRGGWQAAEFTWKKSDMLLIRKGDQIASPVWSNIRGHTFEVVGFGGQATVCFDNFRMEKEGSLNGTYYYKVLLEDENGYLSSSSEPSIKTECDRTNVVLDNIYVPPVNVQQRLVNKRIYRLGGTSSEWRHVGDMSVNKRDFYDNKRDEDLGLIKVPDAYAPPKAKVMQAVGNVMYYGNVIDRYGESRPYRVYRSDAFCPYRVEDLNCADIPERMGSGITGLAHYYNYLCVWTADSFYTVDRLLSETPVLRGTQGCVAKRSVQVTPYGIIWLSKNGLMAGSVSQIDEQFFLPVNPIFDDYSEEDLENAIGLYCNKYYYLFFDPSNASGGRVICCYLPDRLFSEFQSDALDVKSACIWSGASDTDNIYIGRSQGEIAELFSGEDDNNTAIWTELRSKDFSEPGIQFDKYAVAHYMNVAKLSSTNSVLYPKFWANQSAVDSGPAKSAEVTALKSIVTKALQGDYGQLIGVSITASERHKITDMILKVETEADVEYHP